MYVHRCNWTTSTRKCKSSSRCAVFWKRGRWEVEESPSGMLLRMLRKYKLKFITVANESIGAQSLTSLALFTRFIVYNVFW